MDESDDDQHIEPAMFFRAVHNRKIETAVVQANVQQQHASRCALGKRCLRLVPSPDGCYQPPA
jgi:hypothetical protein